MLLGGSRPWIERGQRQGMIEIVGGDQQKTARSDGAAQHLLGQLGGGECLVIVAKEEADDLSQCVKAHAGNAPEPVRRAEARPLEGRRRVGCALQSQVRERYEMSCITLEGRRRVGCAL